MFTPLEESPNGYLFTRIFDCPCGEDVSTQDLRKLITIYAYDLKTKLVIEMWMHRKCYKKRVKK